MRFKIYYANKERCERVHVEQARTQSARCPVNEGECSYFHRNNANGIINLRESDSERRKNSISVGVCVCVCETFSLY